MEDVLEGDSFIARQELGSIFEHASLLRNSAQQPAEMPRFMCGIFANFGPQRLLQTSTGVDGMQGGAIGMSPQDARPDLPQLQIVDSLFVANTAVNGAGVFVQR